MVKVIKHEDAPESTQVEIDFDHFVVELMRGMSKRGFAGIKPPELDTAMRVSDKAAVETFRYLETQYPDVTLRRFYITYSHEPIREVLGYYPECRQWQAKLHELGSMLFDVDTYNGLLRFADDRWPYDDKWQPPGDQAMWDDLADHFAELAKDVLRIPQELR